MPDFTIDEQIFTYTIQRQKRKSLRLELTDASQLQVKVPLGLPESEIQRFLSKNAAWIQKLRTRRGKRVLRSKTARGSFGSGAP